MGAGVVTCGKCRRELRAGLPTCPYDGTPLAGGGGRPSKEDLLRGPAPGAAVTVMVDTAPMLAPLTGIKLGDYLVKGILGAGGMGEVYEAEHQKIGKKAAIKVLKATVAADELSVSRMLAEARSVNAIRHRGIVDIFDFGELPDGRPYLVMEFLDGEPLDTILRKRMALSPLETVELLEEICSALSAAHSKGIVHRDLKPGNVYVMTDASTRTRYSKLLDFGLAKAQVAPKDGSRPATMAGFVVGTPDYIAPEQARGLDLTPSADLYALGVMAFEMVSGQLPFVADSAIEAMAMHVNEPAPSVSTVANGVPEGLEALIAQLLMKEPEDRPKSADAVRRTLLGLKRTMREGATMVGESASGPRALRTEPVLPMAPSQEIPTDSGTSGASAPSAARAKTQKLTRPRTPGGVYVGVTVAVVALGLAALIFLRRPQKQVVLVPVPAPVALDNRPDPKPPEEAVPADDPVADLPAANPRTMTPKQKAARELVTQRGTLKARLQKAVPVAKQMKPGSETVIDVAASSLQKQLDAAAAPKDLAELEKKVSAFEKKFGATPVSR